MVYSVRIPIKIYRTEGLFKRSLRLKAPFFGFISPERLDKTPLAVFIIGLTGGRIAQSVEQGTENPCVPSSILGPATIFVVYASPRDWLFRFHPHDPTSKTASAPPFPLSDTASKPRNRYLSQLFRNGVVSTPIFDTGHNTLIINTVILTRSDHYATRANGVGRESRTRDLWEKSCPGLNLRDSMLSYNW